MKCKSLAVVLGVLVLAGSAAAIDPSIPLDWQGNKYGEWKVTSHYRFAWAQWPDPVFPQWTWEYRCTLTSWRFTANTSASIEALQLYSDTPLAKTGQLDPQLTISIQTDNGGEPSGAAIASHTGTHPLSVASGGFAGAFTAPMSASLTAGNVYHLVVNCDSLTTAAQLANGTDYPNSLYDFRLDSSNGSTGPVINQARTYDGTTDSNLQGLYYNQTAGGAYENQWVVGSPKANDYYPDGHSDSQKRPQFEMFANYDSQTQTVSNPIGGLAEGYQTCYKQAGYNKGRPIGDADDAVGEKIVAHYPTASPVAKKVRMYLRKDNPGGTSLDPDGDILLEVRDNTNAVVASGTVPTASIPFDTQYYWVEAELNTDVPLVDGQTYYVSARSPTLTQGRYRIGVHQGTDELFPSKYNSYMGVEAVLVEDYATSGATWTETDTRDLSFQLAVVIPGDANGDLIVNVGDLGILGFNYGQSPRDWSTGDFNGDLIVNVGDLGILGAHYSEHMPEPSTMGLLVLGGLAVLRRRRR